MVDCLQIALIIPLPVSIPLGNVTLHLLLSRDESIFLPRILIGLVTYFGQQDTGEEIECQFPS